MHRFIFLLFSLFSACESPVIFSEAQPQGIEKEDNFREAYQGTYLCTGDSSLLKVSAQHIYQESAHFIADPRDGHGPDSLLYQKEVTTEEGIETQYFIEGEPIPLQDVFISDDMLEGTLIIRDTLFSIGTKQQLKYYRGHQVLNYQREDGHWEIVLLAQESNRDIRLFQTKLPEDLEALESITPVTDRLTPEGDEQYLLRPSKAEFRRLLKSELIFQECGYYEFVPEYKWTDLVF